MQSIVERLQKKTAVVGVVGLGYVGLPLARAFSTGGFRARVRRRPGQGRRSSSRESYIRHIPSSLVKELLARKRFEATDRLRPARRGRRASSSACRRR